jgi:uncharacterized SAM-binding protein YcdF (DUF218 family)
MDLFLLKKIIGLLIMPLNIVILLLLLAIILNYYKQKWSLYSLILATSVLLFSSLPPVSDTLMAPIENQYVAFSRSSNPVDYIVVLGCSHTSDYALPATSELLPCSLQRLVEAIRIFRLHPEAQVITSGHGGNDNVTNAEKVKQAAILLGIPEHKILVENFPKDTEEEAELIAPRVRGKNVVLVTNADHMPRAFNYFKQQGIEVIAAPASRWTKGLGRDKNWKYYIPRTSSLMQTTHAWYESIGRLVQWIKS